MFYLKKYEFNYMGVCKVSLLIKIQAKCFQITHNTITLPININKVPFALPRESQVIKNKNFHGATKASNTVCSGFDHVILQVLRWIFIFIIFLQTTAEIYTLIGR